MAERVHKTRHQDHWVLSFTRDNLCAMGTAMCLAGHIVKDLDTYDISECLLAHPTDDSFYLISGELEKPERCYIFYNRVKHRWIRNSKTSGVGAEACFRGRGNKHQKNSCLIEQMLLLRFYANYPTKGVPNLVAVVGWFENLDMYCGMAFSTMSQGGWRVQSRVVLISVCDKSAMTDFHTDIPREKKICVKRICVCRLCVQFRSDGSVPDIFGRTCLPGSTYDVVNDST